MYNPYLMQNIQQQNYPMYPNMQQNIQQTQYVQQLIRVNGIQGAKAFQMNPNSTAALFDANNDLMYIKTTDGAGFPSIRTFAFTPVELNQQQTKQNNDYVTRTYLEDRLKELIGDGKQFVQQRDERPDTNAKFIKR